MPSTRREMLLSSLPFAAAATGVLGIDTLLQAQSAGAAADGNTLPMAAGARGEYFRPANFMADGKALLPKLPYAYDALEPHIDARTMELHHSKHHQAYVNNFNKAIEKLSAKPADAEPAVVEALQRDISFNLGGHVLHNLFWGIIGPGADGKMGGEPGGELAQAISGQFGDFASFKAYFTKVAMSVKGSGWAVLGIPRGLGKLVTYTVKDQDSTHPPLTMPILAIDVWEHAYYLKYANERQKYVTAWFDAIHWPTVESIARVALRPGG